MSDCRPVDHALWLQSFGWRVFPVHWWTEQGCSCGKGDACASPAKHPLTPHGCLDASAEREQAERWWRRWPEANVAVATGPESGLVVLDVDPLKGGEESVVDLQRRIGRLPETVECITGGGGRHLYFRHPGGAVPSRQDFLQLSGLDVRADRGYVLAPRSNHRSGNRYEWELSSVPGEAEVASLPEALTDLLRAGTPEPAGDAAVREIRPVPLAPVVAGCGWLRHCREDAAALSEEAWYAMLTILARTDGGEAAAHAWSEPHAGYSVSETGKKYRHARSAPGPRTCAAIRAGDGEPYCSTCPHWRKIASPVLLGDPAYEERPLPDDPPEPRGELGSGPGSRSNGAGAAPGGDPARADAAPWSRDAEVFLLAGLAQCSDAAKVREVLELLTPPDFYAPRHDLIFGAMRALVEAGEPLDPVLLAGELRREGCLDRAGGQGFLQKLWRHPVGAEPILGYAREVRKKARLRALIALCRGVADECLAADADPEASESLLVHALLGMRRGEREDFIRYNDALEREQARIERQEPEPVLYFGLPEVDRLVCGLGAGEVGIVCSRPGMGKSVWASMQLHHGALTWGGMLHVSLEMSDAELVRRDLAGLTRRTYRDLQQAHLLDDAGREKVREAVARLRRTGERIWIDPYACTLSKLVSRIHRACLQYDVRGVVVDYGQLVHDDRAPRNAGKAEEVMRVARALKTEIAMARKLPVWVAVQANRESERGGEQPKPLGFRDLGWSGEWEAVAGRIVFLNPDPTATALGPGQKGVFMDAAKTRHHGVGKTALVLDGPAFRFVAVTRNHEEEPAPERPFGW